MSMYEIWSDRYELFGRRWIVYAESHEDAMNKVVVHESDLARSDEERQRSTREYLDLGTKLIGKSPVAVIHAQIVTGRC